MMEASQVQRAEVKAYLDRGEFEGDRAAGQELRQASWSPGLVGEFEVADPLTLLHLPNVASASRRTKSQT